MRNTTMGLVGGLIGAGLVLGAAAPAAAGNLSAYRDTNFRNIILNAPTATYIDVADDQTSSVRNLTAHRFSGRNVVSLVSFEVFSFSAGSTHTTLGGASKQIDHFDRK